MHMHPPPVMPVPVLTAEQIAMLRAKLAGRCVVLSFGGGVDSTAMLVILRAAGIMPHLILFADVGNEKRATYAHLEKIQQVLKDWGWDQVQVVRYRPGPKTGYTDLLGNCLKNFTLPSLAFGKKGCSAKWKGQAMDAFLKGISRGPNKRAPHPLWLESLATGVPILRLIGYDHGDADRDRAGRIEVNNKDFFEYWYPLQALGWVRRDCIDAIVKMLGAGLVPVKSACFFCPATKPWELFDLAAKDPDQLDEALHMEANAMTGKNSRYDADQFGGSWEELIRSPMLVRSKDKESVLGLGRDYSWNQWARLNGVVDENGKVRRSPADRARFLQMAAQLRGADDNALDARCGIQASGSAGKHRIIRIVQQESFNFGDAPSAPKHEKVAPAAAKRRRRA